MSQINLPQNPGLGDFKEFTGPEKAFLQTIADATYTDGQLIIGNGSTGSVSIATLTQGSGITITNGHGTITIAASGSTALTVGSSTITSGTNTKVLFDNAGTLGEYTISGSGSVAMTTSPTFVTPTLGVASATSINKVAITAPATSATLTIADGKTLTVSNSGTLAGGDAFTLAIAASKTLTVSNTLTLAGTDSTTMTFPSTSATIARTDAANTFTGHQTIEGVTSTGATGTGKFVFDGTPTLVTPILGVATATSLAIGGATIGTNGLAVTGHLLLEGVTSTGATGTNLLVFATSPTLTTPVLGVATATSINGLTITSSTGTMTITNLKTLAVTNTLTLSGTDSTVMTFPSTTATIARTDAAQTFTGTQTFAQIVTTNNAIAASSNAATVPITSRLSTVTNSSAATLTITMTTTSAVDGQMIIVRVLDSSAAAQTITWVNTEDSTVTAPTTSNGSTTLPLTVGFMFNSSTTKWRCIAKA